MRGTCSAIGNSMQAGELLHRHGEGHEYEHCIPLRCVAFVVGKYPPVVTRHATAGRRRASCRYDTATLSNVSHCRLPHISCPHSINRAVLKGFSGPARCLRNAHTARWRRGVRSTSCYIRVEVWSTGTKKRGRTSRRFALKPLEIDRSPESGCT